LITGARWKGKKDDQIEQKGKSYYQKTKDLMSRHLLGKRGRRRSGYRRQE